MENKTYRVDLTPLGKYYFGSENTFNSTDKGDNSKVSVNYLVRSRMFPQQTSLLGLMRYFILLKENALQQTPDEKGELIGMKSFQGIENGAPVQWGKILSISPLFLQNKSKNYVVAGNDVQFYKVSDDENIVELEADNRQNDKVSYSKILFTSFKNYDPKQHAQLIWRNAGDENEFLKPENIFIETFQVGITKSYNGQSNDDAFYKQYFYKLKEGFSFSFYLTTNGEIRNSEAPVTAPFGADQGLFHIRMTEDANTLFSKKQTIDGNVKITLLSDAYCSPGILDSCYLSITNSVDFRYLKTDVNTRRYYNVSANADDMQKSTKLNLLERGSVLYTEHASGIIAELEKYTAYRNAGFNHYSIKQSTPK